MYDFHRTSGWIAATLFWVLLLYVGDVLRPSTASRRTVRWFAAALFWVLLLYLGGKAMAAWLAGR